MCQSKNPKLIPPKEKLHVLSNQNVHLIKKYFFPLWRFRKLWIRSWGSDSATDKRRCLRRTTTITMSACCSTVSAACIGLSAVGKDGGSVVDLMLEWLVCTFLVEIMPSFLMLCMLAQASQNLCHAGDCLNLLLNSSSKLSHLQFSGFCFSLWTLLDFSENSKWLSVEKLMFPPLYF